MGLQTTETTAGLYLLSPTVVLVEMDACVGIFSYFPPVLYSCIVSDCLFGDWFFCPKAKEKSNVLYDLYMLDRALKQDKNIVKKRAQIQRSLGRGKNAFFL